MREYIIGIISLSFLFGVLRLVAYKPSEQGMRLAFAVLLIFTALIPLKSVKGMDFDFSLDNFSEDISQYDEEYKRVAKEAFEKGVLDALCSSFSLDPSGVRVVCEDFDIQKMRAQKVRVFLSGRAALASYKDIEKYVEDNGFGECDAEIEIR